MDTNDIKELLLSKYIFPHSLQSGPVVHNSFQIDHIPTNGITLNKSGKYRLTQDIDWNPTDIIFDNSSIENNVAITLGTNT